MRIVDVKLSVIDNPHSHIVTAGIKGGKAVHQTVFVRVITNEGLEGHAFAWGAAAGWPPLT